MKLAFFLFGCLAGVIGAIAFYSTLPLYKDTTEMNYWREVEKTKGKFVLVIGWEPDMPGNRYDEAPRSRSFGQYNHQYSSSDEINESFSNFLKPRRLFQDIQSHRTIQGKDGKKPVWNEFACRFYQNRDHAVAVRNYVISVLNQGDEPWLFKERVFNASSGSNGE